MTWLDVQWYLLPERVRCWFYANYWVQLSLAIPNPSVPWKIVQYIQRFGIEGVPSPGTTVASPCRTVRYIERFSIEGVRYSERQLYSKHPKTLKRISRARIFNAAPAQGSSTPRRCRSPRIKSLAATEALTSRILNPVWIVSPYLLQAHEDGSAARALQRVLFKTECQKLPQLCNTDVCDRLNAVYFSSQIK